MRRKSSPNRVLLTLVAAIGAGIFALVLGVDPLLAGILVVIIVAGVWLADANGIGNP